MKNQGVVKIFAIALILVCIYQLSFTYKAIQIENEAEEMAAGDPVVKRKYLDSLAGLEVYNLGVTSFTYMEVKERQLNLGLDLQGGMNVVMEISVYDIIKALSNNNKSAEFNRALDSAAAVKFRKPETDLISEFRKQFNTMAPNLRLSAIFFNKENSDKINFSSSDDDVIKFIRDEANESVERSFKILQSRIDKFGVTQPTIQLLANSNRVMVELPGVDNPERVRRLLQSTAQLEFWETYSNMEAYGLLEAANKTLKNKFALEGDDSVKTSTSANDTALTNAANAAGDPATISAAAGSGDTSRRILTAADSVKMKDSLTAKADTAKKDTAQGPLSPEEFKRDYPVYAAGLQPNIIEEEGQQRLGEGAMIGYAQYKDTSEINRLLTLAKNDESSPVPSNVVFAWTQKPLEKGSTVVGLYALKASSDGLPALDGEVVEDARVVIGQNNDYQISMTMDQIGSRKWEQITAAASATTPKQSVAIVLDGLVYSAPVVQGKIPGGQSSIEGNFTAEEAKDLANILKAGKMPAPARIVEEALVGPTLGEKSIQAGLLSILFGFLAVILTMYVVYNMAGVIANLAVLLNLFFIVGVLASLQAALTLPGIAGIILTLGMAVDANVLIYERIKEELDLGRNYRTAISNGFKNAASAILDSNLTTLLAAVVLYIFGSGPISGFAITLIIGIISSLFTAFLITRVIFEWYLKRDKKITFWFPFSKMLLRNVNFDFIGNRKWFYICSSVVILAGVVSMFTKGFDLGVDFKGGWSYVVKFESPNEAQNLRAGLADADAFGEAPEVKVYGGENAFKITTSYLINSQDENIGKVVESKLDAGIKKMGAGNYTIQSSYKVGPTVAEDIKQSALISIVMALLGMFIYIQVRFKRWQFALATVIMLTHDVLLVLSCFTLLDGIVPFTLEIDQAFIAAILTIIGYSINDSVVVFDRVREYLNEHKHEGDTSKVINMALNSTLSRTIMTSLTTVIVVFVLFLFGGETIRGFAFALTIGIILGTYSSLCIGSPLSADLIKRDDEKKAEKANSNTMAKV